jgi:hypothetical protein
MGSRTEGCFSQARFLIEWASPLVRPDIQALLTDALRGRFEVVLAEALDRSHQP